MGEEAERLSELQVAAWLTPQAAVSEMRHLDDYGAKITIIQALQYGRVRAAAMTAAITIRGVKRDRRVLLIPPNWWKELSALHLFWRNGQIILHGLTISHDYGCEAALFDVRFDPEQVRDLVPVDQRGTILPVTDATTSNSERIDDDHGAGGAPIAPAHLTEWWELYQKVYTDAEDTEETALRSARGMFPGKSVSRQRVRDLRGARRRGRKPKSTG